MTQPEALRLAEYMTQPEALRLAEYLETYSPRSNINFTSAIVAAELRRLHEENEGLKKAYWVMRNAAAGYSNYCEESVNTRRCEREYTEAEDLYRAIIAKATGESK